MSGNRLVTLDDDALATAIRAAGGSVRWPPSPDMAADVTRRARGGVATSGVGVVWAAVPRRRRLALLIATALVLTAGVALAARLVIDVGAITIGTSAGLPSEPPGGVTSGVALGAPVTVAGAEASTGIAPRWPAALGEPDDVWVDGGRIGFDPDERTRWIAMAWDASADLPSVGATGRGAVLLQFHGSADVAMKVLYEETGRLRVVSIEDGDGFWVTGQHTFRMPIGGRFETFLVDGNVLLWQDGLDTFRLETDLPLARARALALDLTD